jgi:osmoprotectant transport system permease protein
MGMTGLQILRRVEVPLAAGLVFGGIRTSAVNVVATATIAPLANVDTLGRPIISPNVYGTAGQLGACIVVAIVTFVADGLMVLLQRAVTPRGIKVQAGGRSPRRAPFFMSPKRSIETT